jgi:hypothetical protein
VTLHQFFGGINLKIFQPKIFEIENALTNLKFGFSTTPAWHCHCFLAGIINSLKVTAKRKIQ